MTLIQPPRTERSKRQMQRKIARVTAEAKKHAQEREIDLYARIKAGEACPTCGKDYDVTSTRDICQCGLSDDEHKENQQADRDMRDGEV